jgi:predicted ribosomally synthesized peptide with SipW-like signal peptide
MNKPRSVVGKLTATVAVLLAFAGFVGVGTLAVFSDSQTVTNNAFTTGDVDITAAPASAVFTVTNMAPGDVITPPNGIRVTNDGSLEMRYSISSTATNADFKALKDELDLTVKTADTPGGTTCGAFTGSELYAGDLDAAAGQILGSNAQGDQTGDRTLAAGGSETLCFRVELPLTTGNAFSNATTTATFTFDAEQTINNP